MIAIDLNCDMGELKPSQNQNFDHKIMPFISSCNIACGFHSGNPTLIDQTIQLALEHKVKIGAHPSYNDPKYFGRKSLKINPQTLIADLKYQIYALKGIVEYYGERLNHVKAHGALYNDMLQNEYLAIRFVHLVKAIDPKLKILALAHSQVIEQCKRAGVPYIPEGFADRKYQQKTQLRNRQLKDAVLHDNKAILAQVGLFLEGKVQLHDSKLCQVQVNSICLHSDTKGAVALIQTIYNYLKNRHISICAN